MSFVSFLLAVGSLLPLLVLGAPTKRSELSFRIGTIDLESRDSNAPFSLQKRNDLYRMYVGTADAPEWPSMDTWFASYDEMFKGNLDIMRQSCAQWNVPLNSDSELSDVYRGISTVSGETQVDARFILAILLQESNGCVRAPTTNWGVRNPGLMQDHDGAATCNEGGSVQTPCPKDTIVQMIRDGVAGTPAGDGLIQLLQQAGGNDHSKYYTAARMYNSGSVDPSGDLGAGIATHCYVSDIANRLTGWVYAQSSCTLDGAPHPPISRSSGGVQMPEWMKPTPTPPPSTPPAPPPPPPVKAPPGVTQQGPNEWKPELEHHESKPAPKPASKPTPKSAPKLQPPKGKGMPKPNFFAPKAMAMAETKPEMNTKIVEVPQVTTAKKLAPGVTTECAEYYRVVDGDFCNKVADQYGTSFAVLRQLNTQLDATCSNLWLGYDYCVRAR